ncbi:Uncharacterized protein TCM_023863 [Theobroma cacao]|uniref:Uncharacterized protein n=1 Tax=Theobroma cacao TaxID=3641 RepID=A0A061EWG9_THECC|nr:Uncharacterized protein TCM_023863 [Theobroma cacao]
MVSVGITYKRPKLSKETPHGNKGVGPEFVNESKQVVLKPCKRGLGREYEIHDCSQAMHQIEHDMGYTNLDKDKHGQDTIFDSDLRLRYLAIRKEAEEIWELTKKLGLNFKERKDEVIQRNIALE